LGFGGPASTTTID